MKILDSHVHVNHNSDNYGEEMLLTFQYVEDGLRNGLFNEIQIMAALVGTSNSLLENERLFQRINSSPYFSKIHGLYWPHVGEAEQFFVDEYKVSGIKYHPSVSWCPIYRARDVLQLAENNGLFILVHCGRGQPSNFTYLLKAAKEFSNVNFVAAHLGGLSPPLVCKALELIEKEDPDNVYLDTSSVPVPALIKRAIAWNPEHILFGSDAPFHNFKVAVYALKESTEDEKIIRNILYYNIKNLYGKCGL